MLVLGRKELERVQIGPDIIVTVVRIGHNIVRLGIEAPGEYHIARKEPIDVAGDSVLDRPLRADWVGRDHRPRLVGE